LGYRTIGEVRTVPMRLLREQFGEEAMTILRAITGQGDRHVRADYPECALSTRMEFDAPLESRGALANAVEAIARELGKSLRTGDLAGKKVQMWLEPEAGAPEKRERTFAKVFSSEGSLLPALGLLLHQAPKQPPLAIRVRLLELTRLRQTQANLEGNLSKDESDRSVFVALEKVRHTFGDSVVLAGADLPDPRRVRVLRSWKHATGWQ
jgi:nucleotidyltransferase/DNA polymerase involved in DNA repair